MIRLTLTLIACAFVFSAQAEPAKVNWSDLIDPSSQTYDDPFVGLSFEQLSALRDVARARMTLADDDLPADTRSDIEETLADREASLSEDGLDIDWLLEQRWIVAERRERAFTAGNPDLDGQAITLAGFALPGPPDADGTPTAYLVAERGACSHTPPPNPNQMVRIKLTGAWRPTRLHEPVRVSGPIKISRTQETVFMVDGQVIMDAVFTMDASRVETIEMLHSQQANSEWINNIRAKLQNKESSE